MRGRPRFAGKQPAAEQLVTVFVERRRTHGPPETRGQPRDEMVRIARTDLDRMVAVGHVRRIGDIRARGERRFTAERHPARMQRDTDQQPGRVPANA